MIQKTLFAIGILNCFIAFSQVQFEKTYGAEGTEYGNSFKCTSDGGFIIVGESSGNLGASVDSDTYLIKTDINGDTLWTKLLGTNLDDKGWDVLELETDQQGRYLILSSLNQSQGINLTQTDSIGNVLWTKNYLGTTFWTYGSLVHGLNNEIIFLGRTLNSGNWRPQVFAVNDMGDSLWSKTYTNGDMFYAIKTVSDGYMLAGCSSESSLNDMVFKKIDAVGNEIWRQTYGGAGYDNAYALNTTADGGYVFVGSSSVFSNTDDDICIVKTTNLGVAQWSNTFGGSSEDVGHAVYQLGSGGFVILGNAANTPNQFSNMVYIQTDNLGNELNTTYLGQSSSSGNCLQKANDGTFVLLGSIITLDSGYEAYLVKVDGELGINNNQITSNSSMKFFPNPMTDSGCLQFDCSITGKKCFKLYDQFGNVLRKIEDITECEISIERENLKAGVYYYEVSSSREKSIGKIVIQ